MTKRQLEADPGEDEPAAMAMARKAVLLALGGDSKLIEHVTVTADGKPTQTILTADATKLFDVTCDPSGL